MRSQMSSTSASKWLHSRIVLPRRQLDKQIFHLPRAHRIHPRRRLVQNQQVGVVDQCLRQPDAPRHPLGKRPHRPVAHPRQPHHPQQRLDAFFAHFAGQAENTPVKIQRLARRQIPVQIGLFRQIADAGRDVRIVAHPPQHKRMSFGRSQQIENHLNRGRLARTIGAEKPVYLVIADLKIQAIDRHHLGAPPPVGKHLGQSNRFYRVGIFSRHCLSLRYIHTFSLP